MIISPGRKYIFVHIPKTGGTSMALALEARAQKDDILIGDTPKARKRKRRLQRVATAGRLWKHSTLEDIRGDVLPPDLETYCVFTMVRNPWDRFVSYYSWLKTQSFDHPAVDLAVRLEFSDFLIHEQTRASLGAETFGGYVTVNGIERCDHFVRIEHLAEDIAPVEDWLGFKILPLSHENRSERRADYRTYYSDRDAERLATLCARDIARFGYSF